MATAAAPHAAKLTASKFPADFVQQLRAAADAVRASIDTRAGHRVQGAGATKQVGSALRQGRNAVATLDALVSHLILGNDRLEREWRTAKRVVKVATRAAVRVDAAVAGTIRPAEEPKAVPTAVPSAATAPVAQEVAATKVA